MKFGSTRVLDGSALGLSGLCLLHCLALPVFAALLPAFGFWARTEWVHVLFVLVAAPLAALALLRPVHGRLAPAVLIGLGVMGVLLLGLGAFGPGTAHIPATVAGSVSLVCAHILNLSRHSRLHTAAC